jgi:hypothetical protein
MTACAKRLLGWIRGDKACVASSTSVFTQAFHDLRNTEDTFAVLDKKYENKWRDLTGDLREAVAEKQPKAVLRSLCRRRRLVSQRREALLLQKDTLFQKRLKLEQMSLTVSHAQGLKAVLTVCKEIALNLNSDEVDTMMEDLSELSDAATDTREILTESLGEFTEIDDESLEQELLSLQESPLQALPRAPVADILLPAVPEEDATVETSLLAASQRRRVAQ